MTSSLNDWVERLSAAAPPAMPSTIERVESLFQRSSATNMDFERAIARDPGFALSIFRRFGMLRSQPKEPALTLSHAVSLLGLHPISEGTKQLPRLDSSSSNSSIGLRAAYSRACHASFYARHWGGLRGDTNPVELELAALLCFSGEFALWTLAPDRMEKIERRLTQGLSRDQASLAVLGFTLQQLSHQLARTWHLPPLVSDSLLPTGAFKQRSLGVMLAASLAEHSSRSWYSMQTLELVELAGEYVRQTPERSSGLQHSLSAQAGREMVGLGLPAAAFSLLQPTPAAEADPMTDPAQPREPAPAVAPPLAAEPAPPSLAAVERAPEQPPKADQKQPAPPPGTPPNQLQQALVETMRALRDDLGLQRAMFAMLSPDRKRLQARFVIGTNRDAPLRKFQLELEQPSLFSMLIDKPQGIWLNSDNQQRFLPLIPTPLQASVNTSGFFSSSLFAKDKPLGILYADHNDPDSLNEEGFVHFRRLAKQLGERLGGRPNAGAA